MDRLNCLILFVILCIVNCNAESKDTKKCTVTTVSGTHAPHTFCAGDLIFEDEFDTLDVQKWKHENTLSGGGNWEFQWYTNNRTNSYTKDGKLYITPTLTADQFGEKFLSSGVLDLDGGSPADECTNPSFYGCKRVGNSNNIINPVKSARINTANSFNFKYGRVEVSAKMPTGDWLWPAIWLLPRYNAYGSWPASGEIDILESRGNEKLVQDGKNIGAEMGGATLHYGPDPSHNGWSYAHFDKNTDPDEGFDKDFHNYTLEWTPEYLKFFYDDEELGSFEATEDGFWNLGRFNNSGLQNPWRNATNMAPFDQEFYMILNVAVGGTNGFFPDNAENPKKKPWENSSHRALTDFWDGRESWLPTWKLNEDHGADASLQVNYVKIYAV